MRPVAFMMRLARCSTALSRICNPHGVAGWLGPSLLALDIWWGARGGGLLGFSLGSGPACRATAFWNFPWLGPRLLLGSLTCWQDVALPRDDTQPRRAPPVPICWGCAAIVEAGAQTLCAPPTYGRWVELHLLTPLATPARREGNVAPLQKPEPTPLPPFRCPRPA